MWSEGPAVTTGRNAELTGKICFEVPKFDGGLLQPNKRCGRNAGLKHDLTLTLVDEVAVIVGGRQTRHLGACQADWSTRCISQNSVKAAIRLHKSSDCRNTLACGACKACMRNTIRRLCLVVWCGMLLRRKLIRHDSYSRCRLYACPGRIARHFYLLAWCRLRIYTASPSPTTSEGFATAAQPVQFGLSQWPFAQSLLVRVLSVLSKQRQLYSTSSGRGKCVRF